MQIRLVPSVECRRHELIEHCHEITSRGEIATVPLESITPASRAALAAHCSEQKDGQTVFYDLVGRGYPGYPSTFEVPIFPRTAEDWNVLFTALAAHWEAHTAAKAAAEMREKTERTEALRKAVAEARERINAGVYLYQDGDRLHANWPEHYLSDAPIAEAEELHERWTELRRVDQAAKTAREEAANEEKAAARKVWEAAKAEWIGANGSDFLKKAFTAGYDCQRKYVQERAAIELPGFDFDSADKADVNDRSCPSNEALDIALAVNKQYEDDPHCGATVVWMEDPGKALWEAWGHDPEALYDDPFTPCEAVHVYGFLGRYHLYRLMTG